MRSLREMLNKPASEFICVSQRKLLHGLLLQVRARPEKARLSIGRPKFNDIRETDEYRWPNDINGFEDLKESLCSWNLRDDVARFLFNSVRRVLGDNQPSRSTTCLLTRTTDELYGVTCKHVRKARDEGNHGGNLYTEAVFSGVDPVFHIHTERLAVAFIRLKGEGPLLHNLMPFFLNESIDPAIGDV